MKKVGNSRGARIYECNVPKDFPRATEHSDSQTLEAWIRAKYEHHRFFGQAAYDEIMNGSAPASSTLSSSKTPSFTTVSHTPAAPAKNNCSDRFTTSQP